MVRRKLLAWLEPQWPALCLWITRRLPCHSDRSLRLLTRLADITGMPRPCPVRTRRD
jgi:hypothetical protein